ncbi:MAG: hypothetical protein V2A62_02645 [Candidatus Woesearchaeota archaeon]
MVRERKRLMLFSIVFIILWAIFIWAEIPTATENKWEDPSYYNDLDWGTVTNWGNVRWELVDWNSVSDTNLNANSFNSILQNNPSLMTSNPGFLNRFEQRIQNFNENDFAQLNQKTLNTWLNHKSNGKLNIASGGTISGYNGKEVKTTKCEFNPETLPAGQFEIDAEGNLISKSSFNGKFSGKINYNSDSGNLETIGTYVDAKNNVIVCSEKCTISVSEDGTISRIVGTGRINGITVRDLEQVRFNGDLITFKPNQKTSEFSGVRLFSSEDIEYSPKEGNFKGNNFQVIFPGEGKTFEGKNILFLDKEDRKVALLNSGKTTFDFNDCKEDTKFSCISANPDSKRITVTARGSDIKIDGEGYKNIDVNQIEDESIITLMNGPNKVSLFDKNGVHPRMLISDSGLEIRYNYQKEDGTLVTQVSGKDGDQWCVEGKCQECNYCRII